MNILSDLFGLITNKKIVTAVEPDDYIMLGRNEPPDITGVASPVPTKSIKLIKASDLFSSGNCSYENVENSTAPGTSGVYYGNTLTPCTVEFRSLRPIGNNINIVENDKEIEISTDGEPNTADNVGTGIGLYKTKTGENLDFKSLESSDGSVVITANTNTVDLRVTGGGSQVQSNWTEVDSMLPSFILNKPTIPAAQINSDWNAISGLAQILNKPSIPAAQLQSDWNQTNDTLADYIKNKPSLTGYVPYTGATTDVNLGEHELKAGQLTLDTTPTGTASVGTTRWNDTAGVSETTLKGGSVIIKNGVDLVARVVNKVTPNATLTKANYHAVRVSGAQGQRLAVEYAQANSDANSADTIGIVCENIATNQEGFILTVGQLEEINTTGSLQSETWVDGDVLYLSPTTPGHLTNIKPTGLTGHIVVIGYVEYAHATAGKIYVKIMNGWELDELHNVYITSPQNKNILSYVTPDNLWENQTLTQILGGVSSQYVRGDGTLASFPSVSGGGGGQVFYANGGTSQGTIGGATFEQLSSSAVIGTNTDFISGTVDNIAFANFITDIGQPTQETVPAGVWIFQCYLTASATTSCQIYATVEVYDGISFTVLATSFAETITNGSTIDLYTFTCAVPEYTPLTVTDRIAIRFYPVNLSGNTITLHTQGTHLSSIQTTFTTGLSALDGLTASSQYLQTGTTGTDFNISTSSTDTHLFNLPIASAANTGKLSNSDWTIFNNKISGSGIINQIAYFSASGIIASLSTATYPSLIELTYVKGVTSGIQAQLNAKLEAITINSTGLTSGTANRILFENTSNQISEDAGLSYPSNVLTVLRAGAKQVDIGFDNANKTTIKVDNTGIVNITAAGTDPTLPSIVFGNSITLPYNEATTTFNINAQHYTIDCTSGTFTVTLPTAASIAGRIYVIKNSGVGVITVATTSSQTIDGATTYTISISKDAIKVQSTGTNWIII